MNYILIVRRPDTIMDLAYCWGTKAYCLIYAMKHGIRNYKLIED